MNDTIMIIIGSVAWIALCFGTWIAAFVLTCRAPKGGAKDGGAK